MYSKVLEEQKRFDSLYKSMLKDGKTLYIGYLLQLAFQRSPHHIALIFEGKHSTYQFLYSRAVALSKLLVQKGVKKHDRVLLLIENSPEFYIGYFAILQIGAVVAPLNIFLKERELAHIINDANPSLIISTTDFLPLLQATGIALPPILTEKDIAAEPEQAATEAFDVIPLEPDDMAALLYTSGTTGFPKGVMLSSENIMSNVIQGITRFKLSPQDRILGVLPLFHSFAQNTCVWILMFIGLTVILVRKIERRHILEGLAQKPTIFLGVPALYGLMCLLKTAPLDDVRCFISGADALPDKIAAGFELLYRRKICSGYGLTEASPFVSGDISEETIATNNVGNPIVNLQTSIRDDEGNELPRGQIGRLWLKGPNIMLGYYNAPQATHDVIKDGWLDTGDLAFRDSKNRLTLTGRLKDILKHKGLIIYPPEIENIIMSHPNVIRVGVIGKKQEEIGDVPIAYVQLRNEQEGIEKELRNVCQKNLASYKVPREFFCSTKELPLTATGKVDKKQLRKMQASS